MIRIIILKMQNFQKLNELYTTSYCFVFFFILEVPGLVRPGQVFNSLWGHRPKLQGFPSYWGTVDPTDATEC